MVFKVLCTFLHTYCTVFFNYKQLSYQVLQEKGESNCQYILVLAGGLLVKQSLVEILVLIAACLMQIENREEVNFLHL